jgi:hypothetical protein
MAEVYSLREGKDVAGMAAAVNSFLSYAEDMETQLLTLEGGDVLIQARARGGAWKQWVGMDKAITIKMNRFGGNQVAVDIGSAKWTDKAGVMALSMFVLWPLAVTSGIGMYKQGKLPEAIKDTIVRYLMQ